MSFWAVMNGLIFVGLLFAAIPGIKTDNESMARNIYGDSLHKVLVDENNNLTNEEQRYIKRRLKEIAEDKIHYIFGFLMSAFGTFVLTWWDISEPMNICQRRLEFLISTIIWFLVAYIFKAVFIEWKTNSIIKGINSGKIEIIQDTSMVFRNQSECVTDEMEN